ncbi:hypothetical protein JTB14_018947 [Gonioctena quinquepunctata]|nr:hypothetical protein JTB14_018947 [Gonioctena quinquepunctata]
MSLLSPCTGMKCDAKKSTLIWINSCLPLERPLFKFSMIGDNEVKMSVYDITSKSVGSDEIGIALLKPIINDILLDLSHIYNFSLQNDIFPTLWKQDKIIPLPKKQHVSDVSDFRPLSKK